jgi:hypothetical protein
LELNTLGFKSIAMFQKMILARARHSAFFLGLLNWQLFRLIPFNKPHGIKLSKIETWSITASLPYRKSNFNHISGLHACALATLTEFTSGLMLTLKLDAKKYRLILQRLEMDYHYQGKMEAYATFAISEEWIDDHVMTPLESADAVVVPCTVLIFDQQGNKLTTGTVYWQIKLWSKVRTKK